MRTRRRCIPEIDVTVSEDKSWQGIRSFNVGIAPRERYLRERERRFYVVDPSIYRATSARCD